jgi:ectoine hydroxylase-related dioxygenase (phytanoyl-CoA dioxygenase family)
MPIESGTTKLLPFSQTWSQNYLRYRDVEVRELFEQRHVQLPLEKGDLLFFSPGLFHVAGNNVTRGVERLANLLQVSSAFGIPLENVDRVTMCKQVYPVLAAGSLGEAETRSIIASTGEGYPFPTSLDTDPPVGGLAPKSQQQLMYQGLAENWNGEKFSAELDAREAKRGI